MSTSRLEINYEEPLREDYCLKANELQAALQLDDSAHFKKLLEALNIRFHEADAGRKIPYGNNRVPPSEVHRLLTALGYSFPEIAKIISYIIRKGGPGKTTSACFTAMRKSAYGAKVLVIDGDSQANATSALLPRKYRDSITKETPVLLDVFTKNASIEDAIIQITPHLHLLPSSSINDNLNNKINEDPDYQYYPLTAISDCIKPILHKYHFIDFDCAPALDVTNAAILAASNMAIMPVNLDLFSRDAVETTINQLMRKIRKPTINPTLETKILLTKYDSRESSMNEVLVSITEFLEANSPDTHLLDTYIRIAADLKKSIWKGTDLFTDAKASVRKDYDALAREILELGDIHKLVVEFGKKKKATKLPQKTVSLNEANSII